MANTAKRILIMSASVGAGHMRAAEAVELALREIAPDAVVKNIDLLTLTNAMFRRVYGKAYLDLVQHAPHVLGYVYDMMDRPVKPRNRGDRLRLLVEKLNLSKFVKMLEEEHWDLVVNTHFLPAEIIAHLRRDGKTHIRQITVTTDFETHRLWANHPTDHYTTATTEGAEYLATFGVPRGDITVAGIPIHPSFSKPMDRGHCLHTHGLKGDRPIVLQLAGGFGVGPISTIFQQILAVEKPIEIAVVAGRNEEARMQLESILIPHRHRVKVIGFTQQMHELMHVADLVVSKPGGLTTSEVLASGTAMVIVNPIPGQESRNSDYLLEQGAAVKINNIPTMALKLQELLESPERLEGLKSQAHRIAKPRAAYDVAEMAVGFSPMSTRGASPQSPSRS